MENSARPIPDTRLDARARRRAWPACAILLAMVASPAWALKSDRNQELNVDAAALHADPAHNLTLLTGDVQLSQGSIKGDGDKATVHQGADNRITRVVLEGGPAHFEQQLDNGGGHMRASAATIDYHADTDIVDLTGNVRVVQEGRGEFHGRHLVYNTASGEMQGGGEPGGRVHLRMLPKQPAGASPDAGHAAPPAPAPPPPPPAPKPSDDGH
jgi:lipopolysaccharide export system protein LptA